MKMLYLKSLLVIAMVFTCSYGASGKEFAGERTSWHGFHRFDFLMNPATLSVSSFKPLAEEGTGASHQMEGAIRCVVVVPEKAAQGRPWSWRGRYFDHEPQVEIELLKRGFHICFVQSDEIRHWDAWYTFLTGTHNLSLKPGFVGMSGGGRNSFTWATSYPDRVSCIYADNPLITREALMKLDQLCERDIPLLHICGSLDPLTPNHTLPIESIYQRLGGRISVIIKDGAGHHPHSLRDPTLIADFMTRSLEAATPAPAFVGKGFTRSSFYRTTDRYFELPSEDLYVTMRGAEFEPTYDQFQFTPEGRSGTVDVIVPKAAAPGKPWVLRADPVPREAAVDFALLSRGFHIVRAPRPREPGVTLFEEWQALHDYLSDHDFSPKAVMECAGAAAREIYRWAIANPGKVSLVYGENPVLCPSLAKPQNLPDLSPLAKAGVPILHHCGSLDPWLKSQTGMVQKQYEALGGKITVIIKKGNGHYPLGPDDPQKVSKLITQAAEVPPSLDSSDRKDE